MKHFKNITLTSLFTLFLFSLVTYTACKKEPCANIHCLNGGSCSNGNCLCYVGYWGTLCEKRKQSITVFKNNTNTDILLTIKGVTDTIPYGSSLSFTGLYGDTLTGSATTITHINLGTGAAIGWRINWDINDAFLVDGVNTHSLDASNSYFYLQISNQSTSSIKEVDVNYGMSMQTNDTISIPNDGYVYNLGYYPAYNNSNVRVIFNTGDTTNYTNLGLQMIDDQKKTLVVQ
ncbi:MAG: calcium-binding EGF-like domain-containing protein [Bacteroidota bacterium]